MCSRNQNGILASATMLSTRLTFTRARNRWSYPIAGCLCSSKRICVKMSTITKNTIWSHHATVPIAHQLCWSRRKMGSSGWSSTIDNWTSKQLKFAGHCLLLKKFLHFGRKLLHFKYRQVMAFYQLHLETGNQDYTAFSTPFGSFKELLCQWVSPAVLQFSNLWWKESYSALRGKAQFRT